MSAKKRKAVEGLASAIAEAQNELGDREQALEQREEALQKALEGVESEKRLMAGRKPSDVLVLNLGGTKLHVSRKTLCQYEPSLLAAHFSGRWDESVEKDADGAFFIDQPVELFLPLINFLRAKAIETPGSRVSIPSRDNGYLVSPASKEDFERVVDYFGMTPFVYQQEWSLHRGPKENMSSASGTEPSTSCATWSTFMLRPEPCHDRIIKSFTVVLDSVERPQIGWASMGSGCDFASSIDSQEHKGVGEEGSSIGLDGVRGGICHQGSVQQAVQVNLQAGSVVTCTREETTYKWLVNGEEVAAIDLKVFGTWNHQNNAYYLHLADGGPKPTVSGKGQWRITQYEY